MKYSATLLMFGLLASYIGLIIFNEYRVAIADLVFFAIVTLGVSVSYDHKVYIIKKLEIQNAKLKAIAKKKARKG